MPCREEEKTSEIKGSAQPSCWLPSWWKTVQIYNSQPRGQLALIGLPGSGLWGGTHSSHLRIPQALLKHNFDKSTTVRQDERNSPQYYSCLLPLPEEYPATHGVEQTPGPGTQVD